MARKPRIHREHALYHVMLRGNDGQKIFFDNADRCRFCLLIQEGVQRFGHSLLGYCLMTNHVHLIIRVKTTPLSTIIQNIAFRYTRHINRRFGKQGHLFQGRFKAILVQETLYLKELIRYVHLNPVRANLVDKPENYFWSGHRAYLGLESILWLSCDDVLRSFGENRGPAVQAYEKYINAGIGKEVDDIFRHGNHQGRLLGDDTFAKSELSANGDQEQQSILRCSFADLLALVSEHMRTTQEALKGSSKDRSITRARGILALLVKENKYLSLVELARLLNRDVSGLSRLAKKTEESLLENKNLSTVLSEIRSQAQQMSKSQA